jgi:hypothetical protein
LRSAPDKKPAQPIGIDEKVFEIERFLLPEVLRLRSRAAQRALDTIRLC